MMRENLAGFFIGIQTKDYLNRVALLTLFPSSSIAELHHEELSGSVQCNKRIRDGQRRIQVKIQKVDSSKQTVKALELRSITFLPPNGAPFVGTVATQIEVTVT